MSGEALCPYLTDFPAVPSVERGVPISFDPTSPRVPLPLRESEKGQTLDK